MFDYVEPVRTSNPIAAKLAKRLLRLPLPTFAGTTVDDMDFLRRMAAQDACCTVELERLARLRDKALSDVCGLLDIGIPGLGACAVCEDDDEPEE